MSSLPRPGPLVGVLVLASVGSLGGCAGGTQATGREVSAAASPVATGSTGSTAPEPRPAVPARRATSVLVPEAPVSARLPSGTVVGVRAVGTRADGTLDVPDDVSTAGWWRGGSKVGDPFGSMLVAAHVDSRTQGLGPYVELLSVAPGQRVRVRTRHLVQAFEIRSRRLVPQGSLAHRSWLYAPTGTSRLTLVTCAPPYDRDRGGYQRLAVVTALPVTEPRKR